MPETVREASKTYGDKFLSSYQLEELNQGGSSLQLYRTWFMYKHSALGQDLKTSVWTERNDPFTQEDLLETAEDQIQELIFQIKTSSIIHYRESLAKRLVSLINDAKDEDPASLGISLGSIRSFYNFLQLHPDLKLPSISLTPENNIYASWKFEQGRIFSIHFLPGGNVRFVIFKPNERHPEREIRISGTATADLLKETVAPYGVWGWISE